MHCVVRQISREPWHSILAKKFLIIIHASVKWIFFPCSHRSLIKQKLGLYKARCKKWSFENVSVMTSSQIKVLCCFWIFCGHFDGQFSGNSLFYAIFSGHKNIQMSNYLRIRLLRFDLVGRRRTFVKMSCYAPFVLHHV